MFQNRLVLYLNYSENSLLTTMTIDWIKQVVKSEMYRYSRHADQERQNDNLTCQKLNKLCLMEELLSNMWILDAA